MNLIQAGREMLKGKILLASNGYRYRIHEGQLQLRYLYRWKNSILMFKDLIETTFEEIKEKEIKMKRCYTDGNCLCVVGKGFVNLQESKAVFIELTPGQIKDIEGL